MPNCFHLEFFCPAWTQTVLMCMVSSTEYKVLCRRSAQPMNDIQTTIFCPTYSSQATELIDGNMTTVLSQSTMQKATLALPPSVTMPIFVSHVSFTLKLCKN